jgi:hypothetical protein
MARNAGKAAAEGAGELDVNLNTTSGDTAGTPPGAPEAPEAAGTDDAYTDQAKPITLLQRLQEHIATAEKNGDHAGAGVLHNMEVRVSELKRHAADAASMLEGEAAELLGALRDHL